MTGSSGYLLLTSFNKSNPPGLGISTSVIMQSTLFSSKSFRAVLGIQSTEGLIFKHLQKIADKLQDVLVIIYYQDIF